MWKKHSSSYNADLAMLAVMNVYFLILSYRSRDGQGNLTTPTWSLSFPTFWKEQLNEQRPL